MLPFGTHTATLYHRENGAYKRYRINGASWKQTDVRSVSDNALFHAVETVCRIPENQQKPFIGDLLVKGNCSKEVTNDIEIVRLRESVISSGGSAFRVKSVKDNTDAPLPHYAASGE